MSQSISVSSGTLVKAGLLALLLPTVGLGLFSRFDAAAQRSDVSVVYSNMRGLQTGLEAYYVDYDGYPPCSQFQLPNSISTEPNREVLERLSTPIAYVADPFPTDPFPSSFRISSATAEQSASANKLVVDKNDRPISFLYQAWRDGARVQVESSAFGPAFDGLATAYYLQSPGPDATYISGGGILANDREIDGPILLIYDPTNGTNSFGSIYAANEAVPIAGDNLSYAGGRGMLDAIKRHRMPNGLVID